MEVLTIIILIVSLIASSVITNGAQRMFMKFIGAKTMYFRTRTKVIAIIIIAFFIAGLLMQLFGIATPNNAY